MNISKKKRGFTLLEMNIVLAIIAVIIGAGMAVFSASIQKQHMVETQTKLKVIQKALLDFRIANNRIPCPADVTLPLTDPNFGQEAGALVNSVWVPDAGSCITNGQYGLYGPGVLYATNANSVAADYENITTATGQLTSVPDAWPPSVVVSNVNPTTSTIPVVAGMGVTGTGIPLGDSVASILDDADFSLYMPPPNSGTPTLTLGNNVEGMVPTNALHLPDDYAIDGWGNRIMYTVDNRFTALGALTPYPSAIPMIGTVSGNTVTGLGSTGGLSVNMYAYGSGLLGSGFAPITATGNITKGSSNIYSPVYSTSIFPGMSVSGKGIPPGCILTYIGDSYLQVSCNATLTITSDSLTFGFPAAQIASIVSSSSVLLTSGEGTGGPTGSELLTFSATPIPATVILAADTTPRMTVNDQSGNPKTTQAAYVLVSFGPNGHGAFPRNGSAGDPTVRLSAGSDNADEGKNCDCSIVGGSVQNNFIIPAGIFVQKQATLDTSDVYDAFDDVVVFGTRSDLRAPTE